MKHIWLKGALVGAGVILVANGSFAAEEELENLPGMPSAENNVWKYWASTDEGNPATKLEAGAVSPKACAGEHRTDLVQHRKGHRR